MTLNKPKIFRDIDTINESLGDIPNQTYITEKAKTVDVNAGLALKANQSYVDTKFGSMGSTKTFKGSCTDSELSAKTGMTVDDYWYITDLSTNKCYNGTSWIDIGNNLNISDGTVTPEKTSFYGEKVTSNNLFNKNTVTNGYYLSISTGNASSNASYCYSDYIPVDPSTVYASSTGSLMVCFYTSEKAFVSGLQASGNTFTTVSNAAYIRISPTISSLSTYRLNKGSTVLAYDDYAISYTFTMPNYDLDNLQSQINAGVADESVSPIKTTFFNLIRTKNVIDLSNCTDGYYKSYSSGNASSNASFFYTDYLSVDANTTYIGSNKLGTNFSAQICFYDTNKTYLSGVNITSGTAGQPTPTFITPANTAYIVVSLEITNKYNVQIEKGTLATSYILGSKSYKFNNQYIKPKENEIYYDGTLNLRQLFASITDASVTNRYIVYLPEETYDTLSYYTTEEKAAAGFYGLFVPDYVTLKGLGDRDNIILTASFDTANQYISTLNLQGTSGIENITVLGNKTRYAVHDDFAELSSYGSNYERRVKNCVIKCTNSYYSVAYGSGVRSGADVLIEDCKIEANPGIAYGWHTRTGFTLASNTTFKNTIFNGSSQYQVKLGSMGSGVKNRVNFIGCTLQGIQMREEVDNSGVGLDFEVAGYGNSKNVIYYVTVADGGNYYTKFADEIVTMKANATMTKGSIVYKDYNSGLCALLGTGSIYRFYGVVMDDVNSGDFCSVKVAGVVPIGLLGFSSVSNGDRIGLSSGVPAVVTTSEYFGVCKYNTHVTLVA